MPMQCEESREKMIPKVSLEVYEEVEESSVVKV